MTARALDLLDLPILARYRNSAVPLDTTRFLTRGNPLGASGLLAYLNPARHIYTAVVQENGTTLLGGVIHTNGDTFVKLLYLAPLSELTHPGLPSLVENLSAEAGNWGAFHALAEVDETSEAFPALRRAGFSVYAWQRIWDVSQVAASQSGSEWTRALSGSLSAVQSLYYQIVPPLLQPVEPVPDHASGFVPADGDKSYVNVIRGHRGIMLMPLIHPEVTDVTARLAGLLSRFPDRGSRPVYVCVRSYQAWLEPVLEDLGGRANQRQAVMVKHLARAVKEEQPVKAVQPAGVSVQPSQVTRIEQKE